MGLETVKDEIIRNAKAEQDSLIAEARNEASVITKEVNEKVQEMKEKSNAETKRMRDVIKKQETAAAELESKKMLLEAKKQLIDAVFAEARKKVTSLDSARRESYIQKLLEKAKNDIEVAKVYCNEKDLKLVKDFGTETIDIIGGLIAENKDKTVRVDYSFDTTLQNIKENELQNISKLLFG